MQWSDNNTELPPIRYIYTFGMICTATSIQPKYWYWFLRIWPQVVIYVYIYGTALINVKFTSSYSKDITANQMPNHGKPLANADTRCTIGIAC